MAEMTRSGFNKLDREMEQKLVAAIVKDPAVTDRQLEMRFHLWPGTVGRYRKAHQNRIARAVDAPLRLHEPNLTKEQIINLLDDMEDELYVVKMRVQELEEKLEAYHGQGKL